MIVPIIIAFVALYGMAHRVDVYSAMVRGAGEGLALMAKLAPTLIVLLTAVSMVRASGMFELLAQWCAPLLSVIGVPPELVGLMLTRPLSGSAALGVASDVIATYGVDSQIGRTAAVMLGSTETTFYTISVYFGTIGYRKTRYVVPCALCADLAGFITASWAVGYFFG